MYAILHQEPEPFERHFADAPSELLHILNRALEKEPDNRYQSVQEMLIDLRRLKKVTSKIVTGTQPARPPFPGGTGVGRREHALTPPTFTNAKKRTVLLSTGAVILLAVSLIVYLFHAKAPLKVLVLTRTQITFSGKVRLSDISPDGKSIAYADEDNGVYVQDISGGTPIEVFRGENPRDLRWAPNGTQLAVLDLPSGQINIVPRFGGPFRRLASPWGAMLSWSPDEADIAIAGEEGDPWIITTVTNEKARRIHTQDRLKWNVGLDWSPSGRSIALQRFDSLNIRRKILIVQTDTKQQFEIVNDSSGNGVYTPRPVWSSQGDAVYYVRGTIPNQDLIKINVDPISGISRGSPRVVLMGLPLSSFSFSKDNKRLLGLWRQTRSNIWTAIRSGTAPGTITSETQITDGTSIITDARISPDGSQIAFTQIGQSGADLYVIPFGRSGSTRLTFDGKVSADFDERRLAWSPDGREIAYVSNRSGVPRVYVTRTDGSNARLVGGNATSPDAQIAWAPGRFILYQLPGNRNFQILDPQTGAERLLVDNDKVGWMFSPCSSPRGDKMAISWNRSGGTGIWLVSTEDTVKRFLIEDVAGMWASPLCWSWDGKNIFICRQSLNSSGSYGSNIVYSVSIATGKTEIFLTLKNTDSHIKDLDPSTRKLVWTLVDSHADVWMIENFDPDVE
jgi:Tol biopolymer transport system component